jgi:ribosome biogenesis GTPase
VVAAFGQRVILEDAAGQRFPAFVGRRGLRAVCGDRVRWQRPGDKGDAIVVEVLPRARVLSRPNHRGRVEVLAANLDQVVIVCAPEPRTDPFITDRYLAAAEAMGAAAAVVSNKSDLPEAAEPPELAEYRAVGYPVLAASAHDGTGMAELSALLAGHTSILVGQSGVGKSSLLNALVPGIELATASLSTSTGEGRHTTTATVLHPLPRGGALIDSPGVRDYAPALDDPGCVEPGFREIVAAAPHCRFADCRHLREPDCAVKEAVEAGTISARRYESYRRLLRLTNTLGRPEWAH